jgi:hypothetical protein
MVLDRPPAPAPSDVEVRRVETDDDWFEAERIAAVAFGMQGQPKRRAYLPDPNNTIYLALVDGRPADDQLEDALVARCSTDVIEAGLQLGRRGVRSHSSAIVAWRRTICQRASRRVQMSVTFIR